MKLKENNEISDDEYNLIISLHTERIHSANKQPTHLTMTNCYEGVPSQNQYAVWIILHCLAQV